MNFYVKNLKTYILIRPIFYNGMCSDKPLGNTEKGYIKKPLLAEWIPTKSKAAMSDQEITNLTNEYRIDYQSAIGSLVCLMNTQLNITFTVTKLAKFIQNPGREHFKALIHLMQYL